MIDIRFMFGTLLQHGNTTRGRLRWTFEGACGRVGRFLCDRPSLWHRTAFEGQSIAAGDHPRRWEARSVQTLASLAPRGPACGQTQYRAPHLRLLEIHLDAAIAGGVLQCQRLHSLGQEVHQPGLLGSAEVGTHLALSQGQAGQARQSSGGRLADLPRVTPQASLPKAGGVTQAMYSPGVSFRRIDRRSFCGDRIDGRRRHRRGPILLGMRTRSILSRHGHAEDC